MTNLLISIRVSNNNCCLGITCLYHNVWCRKPVLIKTWRISNYISNAFRWKRRQKSCCWLAGNYDLTLSTRNPIYLSITLWQVKGCLYSINNFMTITSSVKAWRLLCFRGTMRTHRIDKPLTSMAAEPIVERKKHISLHWI